MSVANFYIKSPAAQSLGGIFVPTALTGAGIQSAIDAADAAGGGIVWLGNDTYTVTSMVTIDPTQVSLKGAGATLDGTSGADALVLLRVETLSGGQQYGHASQSIEGIRFKGKSNKTQVAIQCYTPTNGVDHSTRVVMRDLDIKTFSIGIEYKQNAFCIKHDHVDIYDSVQCLAMQNESNRGEAMVWSNCTFFNSGQCYKFNGSNYDCYFYGCSFDYCTRFGYADTWVEFHGCHFEKAPPGANEWCWELDNGANLRFYGGDIGFSSGSSSETIFKMWGTNNGGYVRFYGTKRSYPSGATLYTTPANVTAYD